MTKHVIHSEQGPGRVRRLTAAVLVNDRMVTEGAGKLEHAVWKPRSGEEMKRLEDLAQAAVGFDTRRGDQVVVENISFTSNQPEKKPAPLDRALEEAKGLRWDYVVHHYDDPVQERRDAKARDFSGEFGLWYPRSGTLGGCTAIMRLSQSHRTTPTGTTSPR